MQHLELKGQIRQVSNNAAIKAFRKQGLVPCNLYGQGVDNILFTVDAKELKLATDTPKSFIIDLVFDNGKTQTAILHELQFHPVNDNCLHVDFLAVNETKPVVISVPVSISGHAVGVQKGGKFVQNVRALKVSALLNNLPDEISVDISSLDLDKQIKAGDLKFDNYSIVSPKSTPICGVKSTRNTAAAATAEEAE